MEEDDIHKDDKRTSIPIRLGLRANINQFSTLVLVNAFVGAMIGLEQTVVPLIGRNEFGIESNALIVSFIASFGAVKAVLNLFAGSMSDRWGRKRMLVLGWLFGLPVPFILLFAPDWNWIIFANVLLGINQGLAWSMTVNMKIDLVGRKRRGLALGLNEFAGYVSVALVGFITGYLASNFWIKAISILPWYRFCISWSINILFCSQRYKEIHFIRNKGTRTRRRKEKQSGHNHKDNNNNNKIKSFLLFHQGR